MPFRPASPRPSHGGLTGAHSSAIRPCSVDPSRNHILCKYPHHPASSSFSPPGTLFAFVTVAIAGAATKTTTPTRRRLCNRRILAAFPSTSTTPIPVVHMVRENDDHDSRRKSLKNEEILENDDDDLDDDVFGIGALQNNRNNGDIVTTVEPLWLVGSLGTAFLMLGSYGPTTAILFLVLYGIFAYGLGKRLVLDEYYRDQREAPVKVDDENDDLDDLPPVFLLAYFGALLSAGVLTPLTPTSTTGSSGIATTVLLASNASAGGNLESLLPPLIVLGAGVVVGTFWGAQFLLEDNEKDDADQRLESRDDEGFIDSSEKQFLDLWDEKFQSTESKETDDL